MLRQSAESATPAAFLLHIELLLPPLVTEYSHQLNILVGQECDYTDSHWSEGRGVKTGDRPEGSGKRLVPILVTNHLNLISKCTEWVTSEVQRPLKVKDNFFLSPEVSGPNHGMLNKAIYTQI